MPFEWDIELNCIDQDRFHAIDTVVMRQAFDIHNAVGRFCDERIYQKELAHRCRTAGLRVKREVCVRATHQGFTKRYSADMVVEKSTIYELKSVEALTTQHEMQLINYLLMANVKHGKLINFRPSSVEYRFQSTHLDQLARMQFELKDEKWQGDDTASQRLKDTLVSLLEDWGAFLSLDLYHGALVHFMGGKEAVLRRVDVVIEGRVAGQQKMYLVDDGTAWHLSAVRRDANFYRTHIGRLLAHTSLERIQWINFNHHTISLETVRV